jgi:hypothetical protein
METLRVIVITACQKVTIIYRELGKKATCLWFIYDPEQTAGCGPSLYVVVNQYVTNNLFPVVPTCIFGGMVYKGYSHIVNVPDSGAMLRSAMIAGEQRKSAPAKDFLSIFDKNGVKIIRNTVINPFLNDGIFFIDSLLYIFIINSPGLVYYADSLFDLFQMWLRLLRCS